MGFLKSLRIVLFSFKLLGLVPTGAFALRANVRPSWFSRKPFVPAPATTPRQKYHADFRFRLCHEVIP